MQDVLTYHKLTFLVSTSAAKRLQTHNSEEYKISVFFLLKLSLKCEAILNSPQLPLCLTTRESTLYKDRSSKNHQLFILVDYSLTLYYPIC